MAESQQNFDKLFAEISKLSADNAEMRRRMDNLDEVNNTTAKNVGNITAVLNNIHSLVVSSSSGKKVVTKAAAASKRSSKKDEVEEDDDESKASTSSPKQVASDKASADDIAKLKEILKVRMNLTDASTSEEKDAVEKFIKNSFSKQIITDLFETKSWKQPGAKAGVTLYTRAIKFLTDDAATVKLLLEKYGSVEAPAAKKTKKSSSSKKSSEKSEKKPKASTSTKKSSSSKKKAKESETDESDKSELETDNSD